MSSCFADRVQTLKRMIFVDDSDGARFRMTFYEMIGALGRTSGFAQDESGRLNGRRRLRPVRAANAPASHRPGR
jgi:hypothetical protein